MVIHLICLGQKMPAWVTAGYAEYARRLPSSCRLQLVELPLKKRTKNSDLSRVQQEEGDKMLDAIPSGAWVIALDERGLQWSSAQLAAQLAQWQQHQPQVALLVGGPEGLAPACLQQAQQRWSLSAATLPHPLVRIVIAEQLYRAWSLLNNHPYHRA
jgi:23S rRNA (pseudouridine1915-N3)-methyltransferase